MLRRRLMVAVALSVVSAVLPSVALGAQESVLMAPAQRAAALKTRPVMEGSPLPLSRVHFVPLGVGLVGSAVLDGTVYWWSDPVAGADVGWEVSSAEGSGSATGTTDAGGRYLFNQVPQATGNGIEWAQWSTDTWGPYYLAREQASWPDSATTTFDFQTRSVCFDMYSGGPWPKGYPDVISLYGASEDARIFSSSRVAHNGYSGNYPLTLPGLVDTAAVYFYMDEGVELNTLFDTSLGSVDDYYMYTMMPMTDVEAIDASTAWAVRSEEVLSTTDGGGTWKARVVGGSPQGIDFCDPQNGIVVGGSPLVTHDGGSTWTSTALAPPLIFTDVDYVDPMHAWAVGYSGRIVATTDGGSTWVDQTSGVTTKLWGVAFGDLLHGWAVGDGGVILHTTDGGATWTRQSSGTALQLWEVSFADADHGVAVGGTYEPLRNVLLTTSDGGSTWVKHGAGTSQPLMSADMVDAQRMYVSGEHGVILMSADAGATWTRQSPGTTSGLGDGLLSIDMIDAQHGWAGGGDSVLLGTADGGATWRRQNNLNFDQADCQRIMVKEPVWASGKPGNAVKLLLQQFRKGFVASFGGHSEYPATATLRDLGTRISQGARNEYKTLTLPSRATPGYWYLIHVANKNGVLALETPFQVCTLRSSSTSIRRGSSIRLSGIVPTEGHWGSKAGKAKTVVVYARTSQADQPRVWDATKKGWTRVGTAKANGYGKYTSAVLRPSRTTWYVVQYPGDGWFWGAFTSVVKVTVR